MHVPFKEMFHTRISRPFFGELENSLVKSFPGRALISLLVILSFSLLIAAQQETNYDRLERAAEFIRQRQVARAEGELQSILRTNPGDPNALNLLGVVRAQQKQTLEAEQLFLRALKISPALVGAYLNLGQLYLDQHNSDRALWAFLEATRLAPERADVKDSLARVYEERREYERALDQLRQIQRSTWGIEQIYLGVKCDLNLGRVADALDFLSPLKQPGAVTADEAAGFSGLLLKYHLPDPAIQILEVARQRTPDSHVLLFQLGSSYAQKADLSRAEEFFTAALAAKPDDVTTLRELARLARARGALEKALAHLVRARKFAPDSLPVLYDFGLTALRMDLVLDALPAFERLLQLRPNEPAYLYMLAVACYRHDEKARTETLMRRYIKLRPREGLGYYVLGATLYTLKRYQEARAMLEQSLSLGASADAEYLLGMIADNEGDSETSLRWLRRVIEAQPLYAAAHTSLGTIYYKQNNYSLAQAELEKAVELNSTDLRAHYQLALVYTKLGEKDRAEKMFARADALRDEQRHQETIGFKLIEPPQ